MNFKSKSPRQLCMGIAVATLGYILILGIPIKVLTIIQAHLHDEIQQNPHESQLLEQRLQHESDPVKLRREALSMWKSLQGSDEVEYAGNNFFLEFFVAFAVVVAANNALIGWAAYRTGQAHGAND